MSINIDQTTLEILLAIVSIILYLFISMMGKRRKVMGEKIETFTGNLVPIKKAIEQGEQNLISESNKVIYPEKMPSGNVYGNETEYSNSYNREPFKSWSTAIGNAIKYLIEKIDPDEGNKLWKIIGFTIQAGLFVLFFWADLIRGANIVSAIDPETVIHPLLLRLEISVLASSIGTMAVIGLIAGDLAGITHFGNWDKLKGAWHKTLIAGMIITPILSFTLLLIMSLESIPTFPTFGVDVQQRIELWVYLAQILLIVPLLIITFMLFESWKGIVVIFIVVLSITWAMVEFIRIVGWRIGIGVSLFLGGVVLWLFAGLLGATHSVLRIIILSVDYILDALAFPVEYPLSHVTNLKEFTHYSEKKA